MTIEKQGDGSSPDHPSRITLNPSTVHLRQYTTPSVSLLSEITENTRGKVPVFKEQGPFSSVGPS
jgi:hypothetical protein